MGGIIGPARDLDTDIPKHLSVVRDDLKEYRKVIVTALIGGRVNCGICEGQAVNLNGAAVNGAAHVGEASEVLKGGDGLQKAVASRESDEVRVEFGGEEAGEEVSGLGDEVGVDGVTGGEGFGGVGVGEARKEHGEGDVGGEGEVGAEEVGFELVEEAGEDGV
eukprot:TRINITY_DN3710_c1_g1_i1.p3 TRINITY_DN3710_c1_g1~~TRINITY_DN3710_c1_g1_i1.p3  ORF type:complete len:163 (+),score=28.19 TRINITY_DN3710_c1_g1_i1:178-666(+)